jgi:ankyrin repeat protein
MKTKTIFLILLALIIVFIVSKNIRHLKPTNLHDAATTKGGTSNVEKLISEGKEVNVRDKEGMTPLHKSCFLGHVETVKLLIQNGAGVNAKNDKGETPLHFAADGGMPEIVQILIDSGADINAKTNEGNTAIDYVKKKINFLEQMTNARPVDGPGKSIAGLALNQMPSLLQRYKSCAKLLCDKEAKQ